MPDRITRRELIGRAALATSAIALAASLAEAQPRKKRVIVWSEGTVKNEFYPNDVNAAIADALKPLAAKGWDIRTASINEPDQGLPDELLNSATVLIWWGHQRHGDVKDELVDKIVKRVKEEGMGFFASHSSHFAKPFQRVIGDSGAWNGGYADDGTKLAVEIALPKHPICRGVKPFILPKEERYSEPFQVPEPEAVPLTGVWTRPDGGTEKVRQGLCWTRGKGRVFYFQVGHEAYPIYLQEPVKQVFRNAVLWLAGGR